MYIFRVPKLEGGMRDTNPLTYVVNGIAKKYGEKKDLILMDNNEVAASNYKDIIAEIIDLGFYKDAKLKEMGQLFKEGLILTKE